MSVAPLTITKDFLQHFLKQKVTSFTITSGTNPGDNYLSTIFCVEVNLGDHDKNKESAIRKNILIKSYPENLAKREFLDSSSLFTTEYMMYDHFIPVLNDLAIEAKKGSTKHEKTKSGINVAKFYGGNIPEISQLTSEPWSKENFIILEDLRPKGFKMLDRQQGLLDLQHCLLVIEQLANFHSLSWVHKKRNKMNFLVERHPYLKEGLYKIEHEAGWRPVVEGFNRDALQVIQEEFGESSDIFSRLKSLFSLDVLAITRMFLCGTGVDEVEAEKLLRVKPQEAIAEPNEAWLVATHGDCWINNLLYSYKNGGGDPEEVVLLDHQTFREACLTTDLVYLIYSSITTAMRKVSTSLLLQTYFEKFVENCASLNELPPVGFTYENFLRKWHRARAFAVIMSVQFITFVYKQATTESTNNSESEHVKDETKNKMQDAYASATSGLLNNPTWRKAIIETMLVEYNAGVL